MQVGDLVTCRGRGKKIGIVVEKKSSVGGLERSVHTRHIANILPQVYYVFFCDEGRTGPYHGAEVQLAQSFDDLQH
jgi:hypothetical protein